MKCDTFSVVTISNDHKVLPSTNSLCMQATGMLAPHRVLWKAFPGGSAQVYDKVMTKSWCLLCVVCVCCPPNVGSYGELSAISKAGGSVLIDLRIYSRALA